MPCRLPFAVFLFAAPLAWAAEATSPAPTVAASPPDLGSSALSMVLGLLAVLALLFAALWLLKRLHAPRGPAAGWMRVVAGVAVGPRERVVILELGNSWLVLGVAPGQVTTLAELPRQALPSAEPPSNSAGLPAWLQRWLSHRGQS